MRVSDEPNVNVLRQKAQLLERENVRLTNRLSEVLRENLALKGLAMATIEVNLPGLTAQAAGRLPVGTKGSERRGSHGHAGTQKRDEGRQSQRGHGPRKQPELAIEETKYPVDPAKKACGVCGKAMEQWVGKDDVIEVVRRVPAKWIIERCTLEKCRCPEGCSIVTAQGPKKLIAGGRYAVDVAIFSCIDKFLFHIPTERQVKQAALTGMVITSQALWDQQWSLANLLAPLVGKIKAHILSREWLGADLTPFQHIKKGGSVKRQVWQLACPDARYFEMLDAKSAKVGEQVFTIKDDNGQVALAFKGTAVVDGAAELEALAKELGFDLANCWSHARRNVMKAASEAPGQVEQFLDIVGELYAIERRVAGVEDGAPLGGYRKTMDIEKLRVARDLESRAVIAKLEKWMLEQECIPGGKLKGGLAYVANRFSKLKKFLEDPRIPLDNNVSEAGFVGVAQGRRNYVGCRSDRGMVVATSFYTVVESCRVSGAPIDKYLWYAVDALLEGGDPLLPHEWAPQAPPPASTS